MLEVSPLSTPLTPECIVYTWDYHSSVSVWNSLRTQPILADEVQTFKSLIVVHKLLQEGHPVVSIGLNKADRRLSKRRINRLDGSRRVDAQLGTASRAMAHSSRPTLHSCCRSYGSIDTTPNLTVCSSTRSISV
jgi:hypothetical protein